jgi:hypothetical protein
MFESQYCLDTCREPLHRHLRLEWESLMPSLPVVSQPTIVDWGQLTEFARTLPAQLAAAYARELKEVHPSHAGQQEEAVDRLIDIAKL